MTARRLNLNEKKLNDKCFVFKDERENLRVGKFTDVDEVLKFMEYIREREEKENA